MSELNTLMEVAQKAGSDEEFFNALLRNPDEALEDAGIVLSSGDLRRLKGAVSPDPDTRTNVRAEFDFVELMRQIHKQGGWPRPWAFRPWNDVW